MLARHHNAAVPAVAWHHHQITEQLHGFGGDGKIHRAIGGHFGDLHGCSLMHVQGHIGILLNEGLNDRRQGIARLGVSSGNGQTALALVAELLRHLLDAVDLAQNLTGGFQNRLTGGGNAGQVFAAAGEDLHTQLVFQQAYLLADTRLRGVQALGGRGHIQVVVRHFPDITQLLQLHNVLRSSFGQSRAPRHERPLNPPVDSSTQSAVLTKGRCYKNCGNYSFVE